MTFSDSFHNQIVISLRDPWDGLSQLAVEEEKPQNSALYIRVLQRQSQMTDE